ncbi:poly-gamma-glutamate synthesis protein (capsule biosynthesis protein) [Nocardioides cavernae]|uniref:Poly-gamma-glutamate synthesis protein (Capsule biosynthesis protein) n=1 Tax=Nocardioides cavernae TaxID=1921566 RepID=A0A7Y9KQN2_9ACTN|nr:CapA family protein [Nocardioides cavernae]NYE37901.1 poly-gamma-glutamate synthesis protein (capsule biosynthesis protein) [Nocardioides cavernae]
MGTWVRSCTGLAAAVLVAGCSTSPPPTDRPSVPVTTSEPPSRSVPSPSSASPPRTPPRTLERPVTIALVGDVHFEGVLADRLSDPGTALGPVADVLSSADLTIANLETSVGSGGRPEPGKRFTFSAGPQALTALAAAGVDVATMANNHALDFGRARLPSTFAAIRDAARAEPALEVVGIGRDAATAFAPAVHDVRGTRVATVGASAADLDPTADPTGRWAATGGRPGVADAVDPRRLLRAVRLAAAEADVVVAYLHWGVQGERCPGPDQRRLARRLVDAGADVVAGSHAHELQGDGRLGDGYVAYGLGNFAWYSPGPTGVLTLTVRPPDDPAGRARVAAADWWPGEIGPDGLPSRLGGTAARAFRADRRSLRACAGLADRDGAAG